MLDDCRRSSSRAGVGHSELIAGSCAACAAISDDKSYGGAGYAADLPPGLSSGVQANKIFCSQDCRQISGGGYRFTAIGECEIASEVSRIRRFGAPDLIASGQACGGFG